MNYRRTNYDELVKQLLSSHPSKHVEQNYVEIESFILAQCHSTGCHPLEFELQIRHDAENMTTTYTIKRRTV